MNIDGAVAVVTGGAGSMGTVITHQLAARGAKVARWDLVSNDADIIACDVSDRESVELAFDATTERFGATPTILINAAGVSGGRSPWAIDVIAGADDPFAVDEWRGVLSIPEAWEITYAVNVIGVANTSRSFARRVAKAHETGAIVNVTSISGDSLHDPELAAYSASKAAANMITRVSAAGFAQLGVRVNAVAPGQMDERMRPSNIVPPTYHRLNPPDIFEIGKRLTPLQNRAVRALDVADVILGLLGSDFVTGQIVTVDGGLMLRSSAQNQTRETLNYLIDSE